MFFQILYRNAELFLTALRTIDRQSERLEAQLEAATRNEELIDMMELEKIHCLLKGFLEIQRTHRQEIIQLNKLSQEIH